MKRYLPILLVLSCVFCYAIPSYNFQSQLHDNNVAERDSLATDSTLDIIAYFCKNDTSWYSKTYYVKSIGANDSDSIVKDDIVEEFMIIVRDSSASGYRMEYMPLSFEGRTPVPRTTTNLYFEGIHNILKKLHCVFYTDEYGKVIRIENWRELRDSLSESIESSLNYMFDNDFKEDSHLNKNVFVSAAKASLTESGISQLLCISNLFSLHSKSYIIGDDQQEVNSNGYPLKIQSHVGFVPDENDSTEILSAILTESFCYIPMKDVSQYVKNYIGMVSNDVPDSTSQKLSESLDSLNLMSDSMFIHGVNTYVYADYGWPLYIRNQKETTIGNKITKIELLMLECKRYSWGNTLSPK